jgi:hypothetical protein
MGLSAKADFAESSAALRLQTPLKHCGGPSEQGNVNAMIRGNTARGEGPGVQRIPIRAGPRSANPPAIGRRSSHVTSAMARSPHSCASSSTRAISSWRIDRPPGVPRAPSLMPGPAHSTRARTPAPTIASSRIPGYWPSLEHRHPWLGHASPSPDSSTNSSTGQPPVPESAGHGPRLKPQRSCKSRHPHSPADPSS